MKLDYDNFEILAALDEAEPLDYPKTRIIVTGNVTPPKKRDIASRQARGEILVFIDDDAYPQKDWLLQAVKHFSNVDIAAVGGPGVTPGSDNLLQKASGAIYESFLMSGGHGCRYAPKKEKFIDDYPSCNFFIRKSVFREIGGFDKPFWPGEDTFLCLKIIKSGKKIFYDSKVLVYHHRRPLFFGHFKQIVSYALHRGYFVKHFPENSLKITYFLPSLLVLGLVLGGFLTAFGQIFERFYLSLLMVYSVIVFSASLFSCHCESAAGRRSNIFRLLFLLFLGIILSHICYGVYFIKGLISPKMPEE